ncbi:uncharacterized protein PAC_14485 [Phialocephala subalpina]|uniref:Uncharacterized protein n=1 Tax=Phialocephala subalpina TaxID=576137 RepID=A0A1L7XI01_9HELO|nr:uncharacterized protein PAC_14485 [Phialocephala subalpina]
MPLMTSSEAKGQICEFVNIYGWTLTKNELLYLVRQACEYVKSLDASEDVVSSTCLKLEDILDDIYQYIEEDWRQGRNKGDNAFTLLYCFCSSPILRLISLWSPQSNILNLGPEKGSNTLENNSEEEFTETTDTTEEEFQEEMSDDELAATTTDDDD